MRKTLACKNCGELCQIAEDTVAVICWRCTMKMCILEERAQKARRLDVGGIQEAIRQGKLKKYRKENGFTQEELAKKLKISRSYLQQIEEGRKMPSERWIKKIAARTIR